MQIISNRTPMESTRAILDPEMNVTLLNDVLFKVVFGTQRHSEALRGLLNAILDLRGNDRIAEVTLLNPLREKQRLDDKGTALDVKARDGHGRVYNIEGMTIAMEATHNALCDDEIRYAIEARQKWERDRITELNAAVEAGEARGEVEAAKRIARQLFDLGQPEEMVLQVTGLRRSDLE